MIILKNILENLGVSYDYSSTQFDIDKILANKIIAFGKSEILDSTLASDGREDEIHFTILYGIEEELPKKTFKILKILKPFIVELDEIDKFTDPDDYDVVIINVKSKYLEKVHYFLEKQLENHNTYKEYNPHVTLAYVKKFSNSHLVGNTTFRGVKIMVDKIIFSSKNDKKYIYKLK